MQQYQVKYPLIIASLIFFISLLGCQTNNTLTQANGKKTVMHKLFDLTQYSSRDEAQAAFDKTFPIGSDATALFEYAEKHFDTKDTRKVKDIYFQEPTNVDSYLFSKAYDISPENQNLWVIGVMVDLNNKIAASGIQLYFEDQNFAKRDTQFQFENFTSKAKVKKALNSILRHTMYEEDIVMLMQGSGATLEESYKKANYKFLKFVYGQTKDEYLRDIKSRTWATPIKFEVIFKFNETSQFSDLFVYGG